MEHCSLLLCQQGRRSTITAVIVAILVVLILGISYVATCAIFAQMTLNPKRQPVVASPADYGLEYKDVEFDSLDGLRLKGLVAGY